jgi:DNA-binding TFAR19-related protein (PDSD5 family)
MKTKLENAKNELIAWLNDECPACFPPLEPYITSDLSHDFAEKLRERLDNIVILRGKIAESLDKQEPDKLSAEAEIRKFIVKWGQEGMYDKVFEADVLKLIASQHKEKPEITDEEIKDFCKQFKPKSQQANLRYALQWLRDKK